MAKVAICIPQLGEGLQEARLVAVLKQPGEYVKRDELIYQMETDKAVMDVESPHEGTLLEWLANPEDILPIGAEVARIETAGEAEPVRPVESPRSTGIPPRTRAYAKEKGLSDEQLQSLAASSPKLMPEDIDAFLGSKTKDGPFEEAPVPSKQRVLNSRLTRASQLVVPGTISVAVDWTGIDHARERQKKSGGDLQASSFTMFAYAVARAVTNFPAFKTSIVGENTYRTYKSLSLGIAVSLPGDELVLAVVEHADMLNWHDFALLMRERIELARQGKDQANEAVTLSLTNMQSFGLRDAVPVVVPPACATLFVGEVYGAPFLKGDALVLRRTSNIALTFDHRVMNGVGAANFVNAVRSNAEKIADFVEGDGGNS